MAIEYELKYRAPEGTLEKLRAAFPGHWLETAMETTYYDTSEGALSARKWTLRRRLENGKSICTLKTPRGNARNEWEVCCDSIGAAVEELCKLGAPEELRTLASGELVAVCGARFTRYSRNLKLPDRTEADLSFDTGILFAGERQEQLCEVELELMMGEPLAVDGEAARIAAEFGLTKEPRSKFKRAYDLRRD